MLVTKIIPIGVPKVTSPHLSCSHTASGSWGTSGCLYFAALNPSLPDFLISPCRTSPSVFTQTRKSSAHYYGKNSSRGGGRQKTMEQASTTRVRKTSSGFPVCKATATVGVLWPSQNSEHRSHGAWVHLHTTQSSFWNRPPRSSFKNISGTHSHWCHTAGEPPELISEMGRQREATKVWKIGLKTSVFLTIDLGRIQKNRLHVL